MTREEYLTTTEAAALLKVSRGRLAALRREGVFVEGTHFTQPNGMRRRWIRSALEAHLAPVAPARKVLRRSRSRINPALLKR